MFENFTPAMTPGLDASARLECGVRGWVYDPALFREDCGDAGQREAKRLAGRPARYTRRGFLLGGMGKS